MVQTDLEKPWKRRPDTVKLVPEKELGECVYASMCACGVRVWSVGGHVCGVCVVCAACAQCVCMCDVCVVCV